VLHTGGSVSSPQNPYKPNQNPEKKTTARTTCVPPLRRSYARGLQVPKLQFGGNPSLRYICVNGTHQQPLCTLSPQKPVSSLSECNPTLSRSEGEVLCYVAKCWGDLLVSKRRIIPSRQFATGDKNQKRSNSLPGPLRLRQTRMLSEASTSIQQFALSSAQSGVPRHQSRFSFENVDACPRSSKLILSRKPPSATRSSPLSRRR